MLNLGFTELLFIFVLIVVVVGPERLPGLLRSMGRTYGQLRRMSDEFRRAMILEADKEDAQERMDRFRERRELQRQRTEEARKLAQAGALGETEDPTPDEPEVVDGTA